MAISISTTWALSKIPCAALLFPISDLSELWFTMGTHVRHTSPTLASFTLHLSEEGISGGTVVVSSGSGSQGDRQGNVTPNTSIAYWVEAKSA